MREERAGGGDALPSTRLPDRAGRPPAAPGVQVRFVVVPFLPEHQPALGVSSLAAVLRQRGIRTDIRYLNVDYYRMIGKAAYFYLSRCLPAELLLGEMIFAPALWGDRAPTWEEYAARFRDELPRLSRVGLSTLSGTEALAHRTREWETFEPQLRTLYAGSPRVIRGWAEEVLRDRPPVVGFTSTFQQNLAALALAQELRRRAPRGRLTILFGGANCEDDMGRALAESFPFLDHVVSGEGENVVVDLVEAALDRAPGGDGPGPAPSPRFVPGVMVRDMDALPLAGFDEYFECVRGTDLEAKANLVAESARGCWWGAKSHCRFCGLNGTTMAFRSKSPARFAQELRTLAARHDRNIFLIADNILDMGYIRSLFPELIARGDDIKMFYETKSNLRKEQLELMAAGGIFSIQPGIESLSTRVLELMGKGTTRLQNLQLLKWCEEFGVIVKWSLLHGFPGEREEDYRDMAALLPALVHLPTPAGVIQIRLDRFGPYWKAPDTYDIRNVRRYWAYDFAYRALAPEVRERVAYFFEFDYGDGRRPLDYAEQLYELAAFWHRRHEAKATLEVQDAEAGSVVIDSRGTGREDRHPLSRVERRLLSVLDRARTPPNALVMLNEGMAAAARVGEDQFRAILGTFVERCWVVEDAGRVLSVVLDRAEKTRLADLRETLMLARLGLARSADALAAEVAPDATRG